ncbi:hypothetical protein ACFU9X_18880 [Streptomyces atratus]
MRPTGMSGPVFLSTSVPRTPVPVDGCAVCGALWQQYVDATDPRRAEFCRSRATDIAVEISRHPHPKRMTR